MTGRQGKMFGDRIALFDMHVQVSRTGESRRFLHGRWSLRNNRVRWQLPLEFYN